MLLKSSTANLSKSDIVFKSNFAHLFFITIPSNFSYVYREYTITSRESMHLNPVYPCAYREHSILYTNIISFFGLSLCIQGTWDYQVLHTELLRFIPVHIGNMPIVIPATYCWPVYPCAYREHECKHSNRFSFAGLSLCIQGTLLILSYKSRLYRFIPVHTGNMQLLHLFFFLHPVYPCAYREHDYFCSLWYIFSGLSLCIQGTLYESAFHLLKRRFIPVHTGNILMFAERPAAFSVYPCAYREHNLFAVNNGNPTGLSLCIQGTLSI